MRGKIRGYQFQKHVNGGSEIWKRFEESVWRPLINNSGRSSSIACLFFFLLLGAFVSTRFLNSTASVASTTKSIQISKKPLKNHDISLNCYAGNQTRTCPKNYYPSVFDSEPKSVQERSSCPDYFRYIHEDLRPWKVTGVTSEMISRARKTANFRIVVVKGRAYVETYVKSFQTRDVFTIWGILQLLRRYPGKVPDFDLMFDCVDWPVIRKSSFKDVDNVNINATAPPPLFRYCGNDNTLDIVFPDWSFWGWAEINIKPWEALLKDLIKGNKKTKWINREPYAYWKGNPYVAPSRKELIKCNVSDERDWNARIYAQDWLKEIKESYKQSDLASQCIHRYKIYIEGSAWSVSEKYILACDSVTLLVKPLYYDFFTRGLLPIHHYWPIRDQDKCQSIKFAVDWGNRHKQKAQEIGRAGSNFIENDLKMEYVYDYMFHLLNEYAKLLKFKPQVPSNANELCSEAMVCGAEGIESNFMRESLQKGAAEVGPCKIREPFGDKRLDSIQMRKENIIKQVEMWETKSQAQ